MASPPSIITLVKSIALHNPPGFPFDLFALYFDRRFAQRFSTFHGVMVVKCQRRRPRFIEVGS